MVKSLDTIEEKGVEKTEKVKSSRKEKVNVVTIKITSEESIVG